MARITDSLLEIKTSEILGRYLVAKKYLPGGTLLFEETPLFTFAILDQTTLRNEQPHCINCYKKLETKKVVVCSNCDWPFCSLECSKNPCHVEEECGILKENEILPNPADTLGCLYFLRFELLKKKDWEKWSEAMSLASKSMPGISQFSDERNELAISAQNFLNRCKMFLPLEYINEVISIFQINTFSFDTESKESFACLYGICSLFSHNCSPNAEWYLIQDREEQGVIGILTSQSIAAGEMVTIAYSDDCLDLGSRHRQISMYWHYDFICACTRCLDPTELNTFFSAVKCNKCPDGWLLPPGTFFKANGSRCNKCSYSKSSAEIERIEYAFRRRMVIGLSGKPCLVKPQSELKCLDTLIFDATSKYKLHPNHNLVFGAMQRWLTTQKLRDLMQPTCRTRIIYKKIIERAERCLSIVDCVGTIPDRLELEEIISCALIRYNFKSQDYLQIEEDMENPLLKLRIVAKIVKHLQSAVSFREFHFFDESTLDIIKRMSERYIVWKDILYQHSYNVSVVFNRPDLESC